MTESKLLVATTNAGKIREIRKFLSGSSISVLALDAVLPGAKFEETGTTFLENARAKSLHYGNLSGLPSLAEDSGLEVEALGGEPGVYSARYSGPGATDAKNIRKVLGKLEGIPWEKRRARFVCVMALSAGGRIVRTFRGEVHGTIALEPKGADGFGYDPVFYYHPFRRTFAEVGPERKNAVSHRGRALKRLAEYLAAHPLGDSAR